MDSFGGDFVRFTLFKFGCSGVSNRITGLLFLTALTYGQHVANGRGNCSRRHVGCNRRHVAGIRWCIDGCRRHFNCNDDATATSYRRYNYKCRLLLSRRRWHPMKKIFNVDSCRRCGTSTSASMLMVTSAVGNKP